MATVTPLRDIAGASVRSNVVAPPDAAGGRGSPGLEPPTLASA
jgi:hypothetical protein